MVRIRAIARPRNRIAHFRSDDPRSITVCSSLLPRPRFCPTPEPGESGAMAINPSSSSFKNLDRITHDVSPHICPASQSIDGPDMEDVAVRFWSSKLPALHFCVNGREPLPPALKPDPSAAAYVREVKCCVCSQELFAPRHRQIILYMVSNNLFVKAARVGNTRH